MTGDLDKLLHADEFTRTLVGVEARVEALHASQLYLLDAMAKLVSIDAEDDTPPPESTCSVEQAVATVNKFIDQLTTELHRLHALHAGRR